MLGSGMKFIRKENRDIQEKLTSDLYSIYILRLS